MRFDTDKHKLRKLWEENKNNENLLNVATLKQDQKYAQIKLLKSNNTQFNKFQSFNTDWLVLSSKLQSDAGIDIYRSAGLQVELLLPKQFIPYIRINIACRRTDQLNISENSTVSYNSVCNVIDTESNLKKVSWDIVFIQSTGSIWYDYEIKFLFTLINPNYFTAS